MDYMTTHGHLLDERDRLQTAGDFEAWIDTNSEEPEPQCGQCSHFRFKDLVGDGGDGWCQLRTVINYEGGADTKEDRDMSDDACPKFLMGIPF